MAYPVQLNRVGSAYVQCLLVQVAVFMGANDMRNKDEDGLSFRVISGALPEEPFQNWNLAQSWNAGQLFGLRVFQHAAEHVYLAFLQPNFVLDLALPNHGLADAT